MNNKKLTDTVEFAENKPIFAVRIWTGNITAMKKDIHPDNYRLVVFRDISVDKSWLAYSCAPSRESVSWEDGNEYPPLPKPGQPVWVPQDVDSRNPKTIQCKCIFPRGMF